MEKATEPGKVTFAEKMVVRKAIEEAGIPYTYVSANCFAGYFVGGLCQFGKILPSTDSVVIHGDGNVKGTNSSQTQQTNIVFQPLWQTLQQVKSPKIINSYFSKLQYTLLVLGLDVNKNEILIFLYKELYLYRIGGLNEILYSQMIARDYFFFFFEYFFS